GGSGHALVVRGHVQQQTAVDELVQLLPHVGEDHVAQLAGGDAGVVQGVPSAGDVGGDDVERRVELVGDQCPEPPGLLAHLIGQAVENVEGRRLVPALGGRA